MAEFKYAWEQTSKHEGGYSIDPADPGGETFRGIARKRNPQWPGWVKVDEMKKGPGFPRMLELDPDINDEVETFYLDIWERLRCNQIIHQRIANELFDAAVNIGAQRAVIFLQSALNVHNKSPQSRIDVKIDGVMGDQTIAALTAAKSDYAWIAESQVDLRRAFYTQLAINNSQFRRYLHGWLSRTVL